MLRYFRLTTAVLCGLLPAIHLRAETLKQVLARMADFAVFVTAGCFLGTFWYLRTVVRHVHKDDARVMPDRVEATLPALAGVALSGLSFDKRVGRVAWLLSRRERCEPGHWCGRWWP